MLISYAQTDFFSGFIVFPSLCGIRFPRLKLNKCMCTLKNPHNSYSKPLPNFLSFYRNFRTILWLRNILFCQSRVMDTHTAITLEKSEVSNSDDSSRHSRPRSEIRALRSPKLSPRTQTPNLGQLTSKPLVAVIGAHILSTASVPLATRL
jgi:hypothetical protein